MHVWAAEGQGPLGPGHAEVPEGQGVQRGEGQRDADSILGLEEKTWRW